MRAIRLLLLVMMLAFLPLQGWADAVAHAVSADAEMPITLVAAASQGAEQGDAGHLAQASEATEQSLQPGSDLAEQLLPPPPLRLAAWIGNPGPPFYAGTLLPGPDLPRLPRPPRG